MWDVGGGVAVTARVDYAKAANNFATSPYNLLGRVTELRLDVSIAIVIWYVFS